MHRYTDFDRCLCTPVRCVVIDPFQRAANDPGDTTELRPWIARQAA